MWDFNSRQIEEDQRHKFTYCFLGLFRVMGYEASIELHSKLFLFVSLFVVHFDHESSKRGETTTSRNTS